MTMETPPALGAILPSSNRVVERLGRRIQGQWPTLDLCFARAPYGGHPSDGYNLDVFLHAAQM